MFNIKPFTSGQVEVFRGSGLKGARVQLFVSQNYNAMFGDASLGLSCRVERTTEFVGKRRNGVVLCLELQVTDLVNIG